MKYLYNVHMFWCKVMYEPYAWKTFILNSYWPLISLDIWIYYLQKGNVHCSWKHHFSGVHKSLYPPKLKVNNCFIIWFWRNLCWLTALCSLFTNYTFFPAVKVKEIHTSTSFISCYYSLNDTGIFQVKQWTVYVQCCWDYVQC